MLEGRTNGLPGQIPRALHPPSPESAKSRVLHDRRRRALPVDDAGRVNEEIFEGFDHDEAGVVDFRTLHRNLYGRAEVASASEALV